MAAPSEMRPAVASSFDAAARRAMSLQPYLVSRERNGAREMQKLLPSSLAIVANTSLLRPLSENIAAGRPKAHLRRERILSAAAGRREMAAAAAGERNNSPGKASPPTAVACGEYLPRARHDEGAVEALSHAQQGLRTIYRHAEMVCTAAPPDSSCLLIAILSCVSRRKRNP